MKRAVITPAVAITFAVAIAGFAVYFISEDKDLARGLSDHEIQNASDISKIDTSFEALKEKMDFQTSQIDSLNLKMDKLFTSLGIKK